MTKHKPVWGTPAAQAVAVVIWAGSCTAVMSADAWKPIAGSGGFCALLLATVGLSLVMRWPAALVAPALFVAITMSVRPGSESYDTAMTVIFSAPLIGLVTLGAALAVRRAGPGLAVLPLSFSAVLTVVFLAIGGHEIDHHASHPAVITLSTGRLDGLQRFKPTPDLEALFGRGEVTRDDDNLAPLGERESDLSGPSSGFLGFTVHRFKRISVFTIGDHVIGYLTTDKNVELGGGVGIGDSISLIKKRGLAMHCYGVILGSDSSRPAYPACEAKLPRGGMVYAGGDPIDSIWVMHE